MVRAITRIAPFFFPAPPAAYPREYHAALPRHSYFRPPAAAVSRPRRGDASHKRGRPAFERARCRGCVGPIRGSLPSSCRGWRTEPDRGVGELCRWCRRVDSEQTNRSAFRTRTTMPGCQPPSRVADADADAEWGLLSVPAAPPPPPPQLLYAPPSPSAKMNK